MDVSVKITLFSLTFVVFFALATVCFLRIKLYRRINKIALYIFKVLKDIKEIEVAEAFVAEYEKKLKTLRKDVDESQYLYEDEAAARSFLNFGHKERLQDYSKKLKKAKKAQDIFVMNNKDEYQRYSTILENVDKDFFNINKEKIISVLEKMNHNAAENERIEQQRKLEEQEQNRREMIENVQKEREIKNKQIEEKEKKDSVSKSIQELENYLPTLQTHVRDEQTLDFQMLKFIKDKLDKIEDNRTFISANDFNNIECIQKILNSVFERFRNDEFVKPNIELIEESLCKILRSSE
ncbi:MAG: hypothetical protein IKS02_04275 [Fibrobacter sp.]|nr:hypothetical protein [Candidatus Saccharibacteria bacterium]MBR6379168.1 hypothetical protein [Fibrobacter sp.]